jgi:hypothetical protein
MIILGFSSCSRLLGWGVLLWSLEDPAIPSGTVLPVYIKSNIDQVWVAGIPEAFRDPGDEIDKFEIPLWQLELAGGKRAAEKRAEDFSGFALSYAETMQDGLPIRDNPDNGARRVYRLKMGQIVKILAQVPGNPAISASGEPLPGAWYQVLTEDGTTGYCFSYRLSFFEHGGGPLAITRTEEEEEDPDLDMVLSKTWSPDWYGAMVSSRKIDLEDLSKQWRFSPGQDSGIAHIYLPDLDRTFSYTGIRAQGNRSWLFEGAPLQMSLRSDTTLAVQYIEDGGTPRTLLFIALSMDVKDLIIQETERRAALFQTVYTGGPVFASANYGTLSFSEGERFSWTGYDRLVPRIIPPSASETGKVVMGLFLADSLGNRYGGAFSLTFDGINKGASEAGGTVHFLYSMDKQGLRMEYVSPEDIEGVTVTRRAASPMVIYFFKIAGEEIEMTPEF